MENGTGLICRTVTAVGCSREQWEWRETGGLGFSGMAGKCEQLNSVLNVGGDRGSTIVKFTLLLPVGSNGFVFEDEEVATSADHIAMPEGDNMDFELVPTTTLPFVMSNVNLSSQNKCFSNELNKSFEPKTFYEASKDQHWIEAMNTKMDALYRNDTWEITDLPIGRKAIGGINFDDTFSPVVKIVTVRCVVNLDVQNNWSICQLDVNNAFLYGDLDETVYMTLLEGYFNPGENRVSLLVYVDDIIITGNNSSEIEKLKAFLNTKFMIKDLGRLKYFLGIKVIDTENGLCLSQRKYCLDLLTEFGLLACKPSATPLEQNVSMTNKPTVSDPVLDNVTEYQKLIGKLIYLTHTRHDISYSVHCLSQFIHKPLKSHLKIALKVLRYLKGCPGKGLHIVKQSKSSLEAFMDADWAKCIVTRKSVTGFCVKLNGSLVSWKRKKQNSPSKSSAEAEYKAMASVTSEIVWILNILKDLNWEHLLPINLFGDS
nr:ribonuclease H-like domain-containing protein [Tanacetum cinerariifolium]